VVELLLAAAVFGVVSLGLIGTVIYGRESMASSNDHDQGAYLAGEGLDAARNIANSSYAALTVGTHGITVSGGQWALSGTSDTTGIFTRVLTVASAGTNRLLVTSTVTWPLQGNGTGSVTLTARIGNWESNIKLWTNAVISAYGNPTTTTNGVKVDTSGNYAYLTLSSTTNNFVVLDISNPAAPTIVKTITVTNTPTNIMVSGNYAYVTTSTNTTCLEIVDISVPSNASQVKSVTMTGAVSCNGVYVSGSFAYVGRNLSSTAGANEFTVVNVSSPLLATVVGGYDAGIQLNEIWVSGTNAFVASSSTTNEMIVVNIATPTAPTLSKVYNPSTSLSALTITGYGNTVLLGMSTTLDIINVTTPTSPTRLGTFTAAGTINDVAADITNQYAFLGTASTTGELQIVNVGTPATPTLTKTVDVSGTTSTVTGVSYDASLDEVVGASAFDTGELPILTRN